MDEDEILSADFGMDPDEGPEWSDWFSRKERVASFKRSSVFRNKGEHRRFWRAHNQHEKRLSAMRRQGKISTYFVGVDVAPNGDFACAVVAHKEGDVTVVDSVMRRQGKGR